MKIAVVLYPGCIFFELALALELVARKVSVDVLTPDGKPIATSTHLTVSATKAYRDAYAADYAAVLVPGGDASSVKDSSDLDDFLRAANYKNILIAAICFGPVLLAKAGVLKGRTVSHGLVVSQIEAFAAIFAGSRLVDDPVTNDANILSAKPWAHIEFAAHFARRLGALDAKAMVRTKNYYQGHPKGYIRPLGLAMIKNPAGQYLFQQGEDGVKGETFYRPLGGGIDFGELSSATTARELFEELGCAVHMGASLGTFENVFEYEGRSGHEIIMIHEAKFIDPKYYQQQIFEIRESGVVSSRAVWRNLHEIKAEGAKLYPLGLEKFLT